jgi:SPP1 family predicted phage head-tail adaptor
MSIPPAGALRRRLTLEAPVRANDEAASAITTWTSLGGVWAAVTPRQGREIDDADGVSARITTAFGIRWRSDITAAMRLRDGATVYAIHGVRDGDPHRRRLMIFAEELAP